MAHSPFILADDSGGKLIAAAIFAIIWGISALAGVIKKANEASKRQSTMRKPAAPPPMPIMTARAPAQLARQAPVPRMRQQQARAMSAFVPRAKVALPPNMAQRAAALEQMVHTAQPVHRVTPPPIAAPVLRSVKSAPDTSVAAASQVTRAQVRTPSAGASAIRRWLRPDSLRKQFILTELLQPALALREPRE